MKKTYAIISLLVLYCTSIIAQTPFDSFAPETSRPMLGMDAITARENPSQGNGSTDSVINIELSADDISKWLSVDPLADKYPNISPYAYCSWNPERFFDPDGRDWYEAEDGSIAWTDYKSQQTLDEAKITGMYLGEAAVIVNGHWDEHVGSDKKLDSEDANPASITIYGRNGANNILEYNGLTVTSDPSLYSMMEVGDYQMKQEQMATSVYGKNSLTYRIYTYDGNSNIPTANGEINKQHSNQGAYLLSVFMHRTNMDGNAYGDPSAGKPVSAACLLIDGRYWSSVEKQLGNSQKIFLRLTR